MPPRSPHPCCGLTAQALRPPPLKLPSAPWFPRRPRLPRLRGALKPRTSARSPAPPPSAACRYTRTASRLSASRVRSLLPPRAMSPLARSLLQAGERTPRDFPMLSCGSTAPLSKQPRRKYPSATWLPPLPQPRPSKEASLHSASTPTPLKQPVLPQAPSSLSLLRSQPSPLHSYSQDLQDSPPNTLELLVPTNFFVRLMLSEQEHAPP